MTAQGPHSAVHPVVLVDEPDDGMVDWGWVEKIVDSDEAQRLLEPMNQDPELCAIVLRRAEFLAPDDPDLPDDQQRWLPCEPTAPGAREFWRFETVERCDLDA